MTRPAGTRVDHHELLGHPADERSDIYGWGIVMYELYAGQVPHPGADLALSTTSVTSTSATPPTTT